MDRWLNRVACVTGAGSKIGAACVRDLLKCNLIVVGLGSDVDLMDKLRTTLPGNIQANFHPLKCDITIETEVKKCFEWIEKNLGGCDILINNANLYRAGNLCTMDGQIVRDVLNTNVIGIVNCTREAIKSMKTRNISGHIILINSIAGHNINKPLVEGQSLNIYSPSKYAVTAMCEVYRQELMNMGTKIKISSISPGLVDSDMILDTLKVGGKTQFPTLRPEDVSQACIYVLGTPVNVQVHELIIKPLGELC